ncbi:hypothetical protein GCM10028777_24980 [Angustibacter speluncae]
MSALEVKRDWQDERSAFLGNVPGTEEQGVPAFLPPTPRNAEHDPGLFFDVAGMLAGGLPDPPKPVLARRTDGHALFYSGQVNAVFGDPESGKTWLAVAACVEALADGRKVLFLDLDHNGPSATIDRLLSLGADPAVLGDLAFFRYVEPDDRGHLAQVVAACAAWRPAVAVVDSVGELIPLFGLSSNSPDDYSTVHAAVCKPLARAGAAVILIDHLAKAQESRASGPTGTAAKKRAIGGVSLRVVVKDAFTPGVGGAAAITVHKDRHGGLRRHCETGEREPYAGTFVLEQIDDVLQWRIAAPRKDDRAPGLVPLDDIAELDALAPPPASVDDVKGRLKWGSDRATRALREWRDLRSSVPGGGGQERGTQGPEVGELL